MYISTLYKVGLSRTSRLKTAQFTELTLYVRVKPLSFPFTIHITQVIIMNTDTAPGELRKTKRVTETPCDEWAVSKN